MCSTLISPDAVWNVLSPYRPSNRPSALASRMLSRLSSGSRTSTRTRPVRPIRQPLSGASTCSAEPRISTSVFSAASREADELSYGWTSTTAVSRGSAATDIAPADSLAARVMRSW